MTYCLTYLMVADYFTKPLQGRMFTLFRNVIMGYTHISKLIELIPIKERVEIEKMRTKADKMIKIHPTEQKERIMNHLLKELSDASNRDKNDNSEEARRSYKDALIKFNLNNSDSK